MTRDFASLLFYWERAPLLPSHLPSLLELLSADVDADWPDVVEAVLRQWQKRPENVGHPEFLECFRELAKRDPGAFRTKVHLSFREDALASTTMKKHGLGWDRPVAWWGYWTDADSPVFELLDSLGVIFETSASPEAVFAYLPLRASRVVFKQHGWTYEAMSFTQRQANSCVLSCRSVHAFEWLCENRPELINFKMLNPYLLGDLEGDEHFADLIRSKERELKPPNSEELVERFRSMARKKNGSEFCTMISDYVSRGRTGEAEAFLALARCGLLSDGLTMDAVILVLREVDLSRPANETKERVSFAEELIGTVCDDAEITRLGVFVSPSAGPEVLSLVCRIRPSLIDQHYSQAFLRCDPECFSAIASTLDLGLVKQRSRAISQLAKAGDLRNLLRCCNEWAGTFSPDDYRKALGVATNDTELIAYLVEQLAEDVEDSEFLCL